MKSCQMNSWSRDKRSQAAKKIKRVKDNMGGSITIGCFQFVDDLTLDIDRKPLFAEAGS